MANEAIKTYATTINHVVDGAQVSAGAFSAVGDVDAAVSSTNSSDYPFADVIVDLVYEATPTAGEVLYLYRQDLDLVSTNDAPDPDAAYPHKLVGAVAIDAATTQRLMFAGVELVKDCLFVLKNGSAAKYISANWDMYVRPWTYGPAA